MSTRKKKARREVRRDLPRSGASSASRVESAYGSSLRIAPRQVPAMVAAHQDYLRGTDYMNYAASFINSAWASDKLWSEMAKRVLKDPDTNKLATREQGERWCRDEANFLNIATLFHCTEPMMEVAKHAAEKLDDTEFWGPEIMPSTAGVLVFEKPLYVEDVWGRLIGYAAVSWKRHDVSDVTKVTGGKDSTDDISHLAGQLTDLRRGYKSLNPLQKKELEERRGDQDLRYITAFNFYTDTTDPGDSYSNELGDMTPRLGRWVLAHFGGQVDGQSIGPMRFSDVKEKVTEYRREHPDLSADSAADMVHRGDDGELMGEYIPVGENLFRLLFSIFALMDQSITTLEEETDRRLARRNLGKRRPPPMVTVIKLRRTEQHGAHDEHTGRWLTYRSVTRGHWRRQPYGPGRQDVKRIWINPYVRGPEDAPFYQPKRVSTLQR